VKRYQKDKVRTHITSNLQGIALKVRVNVLPGGADLCLTGLDLVGGKLGVQGTSGTLANIGQTHRVGDEGDGKIGRGGRTALI
jgi:hypothetical protein